MSIRYFVVEVFYKMHLRSLSQDVDFISAEDDGVIMISLPTLISSEFYDNFSSRSFLNFLRKVKRMSSTFVLESILLSF